jgi:hypothetical protein
VLLSGVEFVYCLEYGVICIDVFAAHMSVVFANFVNVVFF